MVKYQKYAEYKDSGIDWLGSIPSHWNAVNLGYLFDITSSKRVFEDQWKSEGVPFYRAREIVRLKKDQDYQNDLFISKSLYTELRKTYGVPQVGDILVTAVGTLGVTYLVENRKEFYFKDGNLIWLKTNNKCDSTFINYCYESFVIKYQMYRDNMGATVGTYTIENAKKNKIFLPPLDEQIAITHFLNNQTQVIDSLIAKQEKLIELLKEKRQAVISHAVTKGLNPDVNMKDSGVEWLGEVPEHWEILKFDYAINTVSDIDHYMPSSVDVGIPYIMTGDLKDFVSDIDFESCKQVAYSDYQKLSRKIKTTKDDIIFARYATIGTLSYVDIDKEFLVSYSCVTIKSNSNRTTGKYLSYYLKSQAFLQAIQQQINSNTQGNVGVDSLRNVKIILPLLSEQENIIEFLQAELIKMDNLINKAESAIQLMQERRTALISSAVTGKIDVRNWQHPNEAKTELSL